MLSLGIRLLISVGARLVPPAGREEWIRGWNEELEHRAKAGASRQELRSRAREVIRDSFWVRRRSGFNPVTEWLLRPFRAELILLGAAAAIWFFTGAYRAPAPPFPAADRVVILERGISSLGARRPVMSRQLVDKAAALESFDELAAFNMWYRIPGIGYASGNFFDVLGVKPALGSLFHGDSPVVLSDRCWREDYGANPAVLGRKVELGGREYEIAGVLPAAFRFERRTPDYFVPLPDYLRTVGAVARLRPGVSPREAEQEFRRLAITVEPDWKPENFSLREPVQRRGREWLLALSLGLVAFLASAVYLGAKRVRGVKYYVALAARLLLVLAALSGLQVVLNRLVLQRYWMPSIAPTWMFLLACTIAVIVIVRDHLGRCPVCLERLRMPVSLGIWSSVVMDPPGTETVCPNGHGLLYTPESGQTDNHWTTLDPSWSDLFQRRD